MGSRVRSGWLHPRQAKHLLQDEKTWLTRLLSQGTVQSFGLRPDSGPKQTRNQYQKNVPIGSIICIFSFFFFFNIIGNIYITVAWYFRRLKMHFYIISIFKSL